MFYNLNILFNAQYARAARRYKIIFVLHVIFCKN